MNLKNIDLYDIVSKVQNLKEKFNEDLDFNALENSLTELLNREVITPILGDILNEMMYDKDFEYLSKQVADKKNMRYHGHKLVNVSLSNGQSTLVASPYFYKRENPHKKGRKKTKRGKGNNLDCHIGLSMLGFISYCSGNLASEVAKTALLSPSLEASQKLLQERNIKLNVKAIRKICRDVGDYGIQHRGNISIEHDEEIDNHTLVVGIDGGRLRERKVKRGKKKKEQKRQGYYSEWREPKLFTIYLLNSKGGKIKGFTPIHDATMGGKDAVFQLLKEYLDQLPLSKLKRIVFTGDGAPWIWSRVEELISDRLNIEPSIPVYQVIDHTHASQGLNEIIELLPARMETKEKERVIKQWRQYLWQGQIDALGSSIELVLKGTNKTKGLKKWHNYFKSNQKRMQYSFFKSQDIPCGSGSVESAIRRVINLRLKSPGSFWLKEGAERFLFLRSQLISGRWNIFMRKVNNRTRKHVGHQARSINQVNFSHESAA